ncbi:rhodanese-like domain-containing protein [Streptomyces colonosanans]|uniref:Sulfurtransferase n=1 Tax=Streptomyces colonosanans TaxID=1428652 RepID=A0A1S2PL43_9ACTN|nr:rhodanese-like domain-containing protein [Streptomyces colonosanans]OIJ94529.1 sulfurtransferase [Streptomyces colonosanans]
MPLFARTPGPAQISVTDAHERARADEAVLLDVREADEYAAGHAPGAGWQPLIAVAAAADLPTAAQGRPVLAICRSGNRSQKAAELLAARGIEVSNVSGGMRAWAAAGLPVHDNTGHDGQVI